MVPAQTLDLESQNLAAIKVISQQLPSEAAISAAGKEIVELMRAYDFRGLAVLVDDWVSERNPQK